ncbi:MAG TPA: YIP1 family protein [Burkholderiales bacterium]
MPQAEWPRIAAERGAAPVLAHALVLALLVAAVQALVAGTPTVAARTGSGFVLALLLVAGAFWLAARLYARGARFRDACKLAVYGATPLAFAAALGALPHLELVPLIGLIHALYLVDGGAHPLLGVLQEESTQFTVASAAIAGGGLWALGAAAAAAGLL